MSASGVESLTPREREILILIAEGKSIIEIAHELHRSQKTIESHRLSLGRKLNASNRVELAKIAISSGLVSLQPTELDAAGAGLPRHSNQEIMWLDRINDAVYNTTGQEFLQRFCRVASTMPGVTITAICTTDTLIPPGNDPLNRVVMASARRGEDGEPTRYHAKKTPCHEVIEKGSCVFESGVSQAYPQDPWLQENKAESYYGLQLVDEDGNPIGGVALIGKEPIKEFELTKRIISFFAPRLAAMLRTCLEIDALRQQNALLATSTSPIEPTTIAANNLSNGNRSAAEALAQILRKVQPLAGIHFLRGLVDATCEVFGTEFVGVCEVDQDNPATTLQSVLLRTINGEADPFKYKTEGTPCNDVLRSRCVALQEGAHKLYPKDDFFKANQIESYVGVRLDSHGSDGPEQDPLGVMWVLDRRPMKDPQAIEVVLTYFAPRIAAELEQVHRLESLLERQEELEKLLTKAK